MMPGDKPFKTKELSHQLGIARLSFASPEDMEQYLDCTPGFLLHHGRLPMMLKIGAAADG